jgi:hypothetical protein
MSKQHRHYYHRVESSSHDIALLLMLQLMSNEIILASTSIDTPCDITHEGFLSYIDMKWNRLSHGSFHREEREREKLLSYQCEFCSVNP